jgi:uncharacterized linocin/CFP29 family protein
MDILKKNLAPLTQKAWEAINDEAKKMFHSLLSARRFVDIHGPKGIDYASVPLGILDMPENNEKNEVKYGIHKVMPLVELRIPFTLNIWELDNLERGAKNINLDNLEKAAHKLSRFEEEAIYNGFNSAFINGLINDSVHDPINYPDDVENLPKVVSQAMTILSNSSVEGPYSLIVNNENWQQISGIHKGYPLKRQLESLLGGSIIRNAFIDSAFLVSERGGDFEMTIGQDIAIGYEHHDTKNVQLFFTESFTFRVLDDRALVVFKPDGA